MLASTHTTHIYSIAKTLHFAATTTAITRIQILYEIHIFFGSASSLEILASTSFCKCAFTCLHLLNKVRTFDAHCAC